MKIFRNFYMNKNDRKVLRILLFFLIITIGLFHYFDNKEMVTVGEQTDSLSSLPQYRQFTKTDRQSRMYYQEGEDRIIELFPFDPNTADSTDFERLGLQPWQIRNIYKYRAKGGIYRQPTDFGRLYGLTVEQYRRLEPYIQIRGDYRPATAVVGNTPTYEQYNRDTLLYPIKLKEGEHIVLNTADTTLLKKVPGIGSRWARRIVAYGKKLGGYVAVEQLREIDGFPEDAIPYFTVSRPQPERLNLNQLTLNQLRQHPYLNYYQARAIVDYRRLKEKIENLDQLNLLKDFPPYAIERLKPYVEY